MSATSDNQVSVSAAVPGAQTENAPLTAEQLLGRWHIEGGTDELRLQTLWRRCQDYGLRKLRGTRGKKALYRLCDVLHAESVAVGESTRRRARA